MQCYIGIDIAKASFEADIHGSLQHFSNDAKGAAALVSATQSESIFIIEATGNYSARLAEALVTAKRRVKLVNPVSARRFAQLRLQRTKTDRVDARLLSDYGAIASEPEFEPYSDGTNAARQHQSVIEQMQKQRTALKNQLEAIRQLPRPAQEVIAALQQSIAQLEQTIAALRQSMREHLESAHPGMLRRLQTLPGVGPQIAASLIAHSDGLRRFTTAKQLVCYLGACPSQYTSGTSVRGRGTISRIGTSTVRTQLYMGAMAAIRADNEFATLYKRLVERGKPSKVALMAVINKMIRVAFAIVKHGVDYQANSRQFS